MTHHTTDLSVRIESDDGEVLLDQTITVGDSDTAARYGHRRFGEGVYGE